MSYLRKSFAVPDGREAVHRGTDQELNSGPRTCEFGKLREERRDGGLNPQRDGRGAGTGAGQEVGDAGEDADVRLGTNGLQRRRKEGQQTTLKHLGAGHEGPVSHVVLVHVVPHVGITDDGDAPGLGRRRRTSVSAENLQKNLILPLVVFKENSFPVCVSLGNRMASGSSVLTNREHRM